MSVGDILIEIGRERGAQDAKWGAPKDVPNGTGADVEFTGLTFSEWRDAVQRRVDRQADRGESQLSHVLLEEVFEALAEGDDELLRVELIQVAAVAAKWVQIIDERSQRTALRARRDEAGWHDVPDDELARMIELGVGDPATKRSRA